VRLGAISTLVGTLALFAAIAVPAAAQSPDPGGASAPTSTPTPPVTPSTPSSPLGGGSGLGTPAPAQLTVPGTVAKIVNGYAEAPADAPPAVQQAIWAANDIVGAPYVLGGGHRAFAAAGYDCSGSVSFALHGARLLRRPLDSTSFERWGFAGAGAWISVYASRSHAYMTIAGIRLDTSGADDPHGGKGPRWRPLRRSNAGYVVRHPLPTL
jgi:cell wall-associated NlpC family hydrolase